MCMFDMKVDGHLVHKPTRWMTNCPALAAALNKRCNQSHYRLPLIGGTRSKRAQVYPPALCKAIAKGLWDQLVVDGRDGLQVLEQCSLSVDGLTHSWEHQRRNQSSDLELKKNWYFNKYINNE